MKCGKEQVIEMNQLELLELFTQHSEQLNHSNSKYEEDKTDIIERFIIDRKDTLKNALLQMQLKNMQQQIEKQTKKVATEIKTDINEKIEKQVSESIFKALKLN